MSSQEPEAMQPKQDRHALLCVLADRYILTDLPTPAESTRVVYAAA